MDARHFLLCAALLGSGCAETDYATPCDDCAHHGLALRGDTLVVSGLGGVEVRAVRGDDTRAMATLGPAGAGVCSGPEAVGDHVAFGCTGGAGAGTWVCEVDSERCRAITDVPGRARLVEAPDGVLLAIWVGREDGEGVVRAFRVTDDAIELAWGPQEAYVPTQTTRATHDAQPYGAGARVAWLDRGRQRVNCVDLDGRGMPAGDSRTWLRVGSGSLASPMLAGDRLVYTHRQAVDAVRAVALPPRGIVAGSDDAETLAAGTGTHPEVAGLAMAGDRVLLGRMRPDGAELSLLDADGGEAALGFGLGRPVAAALSRTDAGYRAAWRDGPRSRTHFDSVRPDLVVVRTVPVTP